MLGTPERVTQNESEGVQSWFSPPSVLEPAELDAARWLPLSLTPKSSGANALVQYLTGLVVAHEAHSGTRRNQRRKAGETKLRGAVGAIIGGLLQRWGKSESTAVFRSREPAAFTGSPIGARQFIAAVEGLSAVGMIAQARSIRYAVASFDDGDAFSGKAPRYWPTAALLRAADGHGVTPGTIAADFIDVFPTQPPAVPKVVIVRSLKQHGRKGRAPLPITALGDSAAKTMADVEACDDFAALQDVRGCLPPRWYRVFTAGPLLGGRWQAAGREGVYQTMPEEDRLARITINGESVVEVDVKACHLSIMHGLLGLPNPEGDPYEIPGVPRAIVKAWVTATLGKGTPVKRWAKRLAEKSPETTRCDPTEIGRLVCERYPFLTSPARAVASMAGLDRLSHIGTPARLLTHRLMNIEAAGITGAMRYLQIVGFLGLPMHDGLIVARSAQSAAIRGLDGAFAIFAKARVRFTIAGALGPPYREPLGSPQESSEGPGHSPSQHTPDRLPRAS